MKLRIAESRTTKLVTSKSYNYAFNKENGFFQRWGKTRDEDPQWSEFGPEIIDYEISEKCSGIGEIKDATGKVVHSGPCSFCYKSNTPSGCNTTFEDFCKAFSKFPKTICQIAFGIGSLDEKCINPDLWRIMHYCRDNGVIPNLTINGAYLTEEIVANLVQLCGAISVSNYDTEICYNAVRQLRVAGLKQVNIHQLLSAETYSKCFTLMQDFKTDDRLKELNAIVFLMLKPKGKRNSNTSVTVEQFNKLVTYALDNEVRFGFDSCSACLFEKSVKEHPNAAKLLETCEPCESSCFSAYINARNEFFPCSFCEGEKDWEKGISITEDIDFMKDVWFAEKTVAWRKRLLENNRSCPVFQLTKEL